MDADEPVKKGKLETGERRVITINRRFRREQRGWDPQGQGSADLALEE